MLRTDADVVASFKEHAQERGYQTELNRAGKGNARAIDQMLRHYANAQASPATASGATEAEMVQDITDADMASLALLRDFLLGDAAAGQAGAS